MARKALKFAKGGSSDRSQARYDRKIADIESDYKKAQERKTGRAAEVAKAKYEQRMADARDDLAKWTGADRSKTRAAEAAAERNLTTTRRGGASKTAASVADTGSIAKPMSSSDISAAVGAVKPEAKKAASAPARLARRTPASSARSSTPATRTATPAPARREAAPETRDTKDIVVEGRKPKASNAAARRERMGSALGAPLRALAKYNPLSLAASAIFDGEPSKPAAAPKPTTPAQQTRKQGYLKRASEERAAGREGNAKYFEREAGYLKKGGKVKAYAKGGSIDGCAVRGKTKAKGK